MTKEENRVPTLIEEDGKLKIVGDFTFTFGKTIYDESNHVPTKDVVFKWNPELNQGINLKHGSEVINEMMAEKLKQDFLKLFNK